MPNDGTSRGSAGRQEDEREERTEKKRGREMPADCRKLGSRGQGGRTINAAAAAGEEKKRNREENERMRMRMRIED